MIGTGAGQTQKKRVVAYLIDTIECDTAGTQKQLLEVIRRLDRARYTPLLICLWETPWLRTAKLDCPLYILGHEGFLKRSFPGVVRRLARLLDDLDVDLVHIYFDEAIFVGWLGAISSRRQPVLISSRRDMGLGQANQPWYHRVFPFVLPVVNRRFSSIVANSDAVSRYAARREHTSIRKFAVIRNGVEFRDFNVLRPAPDRVDSVLNVGILASLTPVKRHDVLLQAWAELHRDAAAGALRLFILGEGPERSALEALAGKLDITTSVEFVGAVVDVASWLRRLDVGVLCSDREGLSNAILEYMASGLPVVATAVGGNPELVNPSQGILIPPDDPAALASALRTLLSSDELRRSMGKAARQQILDSYAWDGVMGILMSHYDACLPELVNVSEGS